MLLRARTAIGEPPRPSIGRLPTYSDRRKRTQSLSEMSVTALPPFPSPPFLQRSATRQDVIALGLEVVGQRARRPAWGQGVGMTSTLCGRGRLSGRPQPRKGETMLGYYVCLRPLMNWHAAQWQVLWECGLHERI